MKVCTKCGIEKPENNYFKDKQKKDGLRPSCKECARILGKEITKKQKELRHLEKRLIPLEGEIWKPTEFDNYSISNFGRCFSSIRKGGGGLVKPTISCKGYYMMSICVNSKTIHTFLHRLIAKAFIINPNPDLFVMVDHINRNPLDNRVENLRWASPSLNALNREIKGSIFVNKRKYNDTIYEYYRVKIGRFNIGSFSSLTEAQDELKKYLEKYKTYEDINNDKCISSALTTEG
jgi:hypothetical protein